MVASTIEDFITKAKDCIQRGEYKRAEKILLEVIEIDRENVEALFHLGNIFHMKGEIGKAIKAFNRVLTLDENHTDASISLSVLYNDIGKYEEAKKIFERANEKVKRQKGSSTFEDPHINKKFSFKHYELADLYMSYGRYEEALFEYNKAVGLDPSNLEIRLKIAKAYSKKGFVNQGVDELKKLINEHPSYIRARIALGVIYYGSGRIIESQSEWEKVLAKDPFNKEAAMYLNLSKTATETTL